ncbi:hypothetical protein MTR62_14770 [Novosphingobium sp. 1949]|uniref:Uncharacterized protein n=1 Tax=Novosphingobium organovorum TaxID=2930092 RepID=A0ABT0BGH0_9SPHN|nr:hypothetical protein [Novosphingobium organovorum]MCJ2183948.1 hypothetical protein [Novosphingobium organovorum]
MSIAARIQLDDRRKGIQKDLGIWFFVALPKESDYLGVKINDAPTVFRVDAIIHSPIMASEFSADGSRVPTATLSVSMPDLTPVGEDND